MSLAERSDRPEGLDGADKGAAHSPTGAEKEKEPPGEGLEATRQRERGLGNNGPLSKRRWGIVSMICTVNPRLVSPCAVLLVRGEHGGAAELEKAVRTVTRDSELDPGRASRGSL